MSTHSLSKMKTRLWRRGLHVDSSLKLRAGLHREVHAFFLRSRQRQMVISLPPPAFVLKCMRSNALSRTLGAFPRCAQCGHLLVLTLPVVSTRFGMGAFCVGLVWFAYFGLRYALVLWVQVLMDFLAVFTLKYIKASGPSGDRGGWPWRASPVVPSLRRISGIVLWSLHVVQSCGPWSCWPQPLGSGGDATPCEDTRQEHGPQFYLQVAGCAVSRVYFKPERAFSN